MATTAARPRPSLGPALVVVGLVVVIFVVGCALALAGTSSAHPAASHGPTVHLKGSELRAQSAKTLLAHITVLDEPPKDVARSLEIPAGSRYLDRADEARGITQYDRSVRISVPAPEGEVRSFFVKMLAAEKWTTRSLTSPSPGDNEVIAQRSGSDGYQWGVGIVMSSVKTVVSPALAGSGASPERTTVKIELYQVEDAS